MSNAENAVLAVSRALHGKRLTDDDYIHLLSAKNTDEIASYLKSSTYYADGFEGITSGVFSATALERVVNRSMFNKVAKLCKLEYIIGQDFYKYFITKLEIEQILRCVSYLIIGESDRYLMDFCSSIERELQIDLYAMAKAESPDELADILRPTVYGKVFDRCLVSGEINLLNFETAFDSWFRQCAAKLTESVNHGKQKKAITDCISHHNDIEFICQLVRVVKYYKDNQPLRTVVMPGTMTLLSDKQTDALLKCESVEQIDEILSDTAYKSLVPLSGKSDIKCALDRYFAQYCAKQIRFSTYPSVIMYCYMCRMKIEGTDIIRIIEGKRYGMSSEQISRFICCAEINNNDRRDADGN